MEIVSTKEVRKLDQLAIQAYNIPSLQLMNQAASTIKAYIDAHYKKNDRIAILCGIGNNGGDGYALALQLMVSEYQDVTLITPISLQHMSEDAFFYAQEVKNYPVHWIQSDNMKLLHSHLMKQKVIVDALFGTGLSRNIEGWYEEVMQLVNESGKFIISVDMPSGIHSDLGCIMNCAIKANVTITFECAKYGQFIYPGSMYCGKLLVKGIGIAKDAFLQIAHDSILDDEYVRYHLPARKEHSHKGTYGKALLIGGSVSMHGALTLCARSMLRSGVGMLTMFIPHDIVAILAMKIEEGMILDAPSEQGYFHLDALNLLKANIHAYDFLVIGNGMGRHEVADVLVRYVLQQEIPCVMDGDALFACAKYKDVLEKRKAPVILTPHLKEMSYLCGKSVEEIQRAPFSIAREFASIYPCVTLVLKDQYTIITDGSSLYLNTIGNHSLAKGGSGDVLCGIISGLFAQSKDALSAAACGVYVHAKCADTLIKEEDGNSILPTDLITTLSKVYKSFR